MTTKKSVSVAENVERHLNLIVFGLFLFALSYAVAACVYLVSEPMAGYLDRFSDILAVVGFLIMAVSIFLKFRNTTAAQRRQYFEADSYVAQMFQKAGLKAWLLTFAALVMVKSLDRLLANMPPDFYLKVILFVSLGAFSIVFFVLNRSSGDDDYAQA